MSKGIIRQFFLLALCVFFAAGCAGLGMHRQVPRISMVDLRIQEIRPLESVFLVYLRVLNAAETPLHLRGIDCDLNINGHHFASGLSGNDYTIPAYESALVPVTVYSSTLGMVSSIVDFLRRTEQGQPVEPLRYELQGHVLTGKGGWSAAKVPFQTTGELFLPGPE
jgi:LEA14-like dessication related protein